MKSLPAVMATLASAFTLVSCDSPELVAKRDKQALEITRLKGELQVLQEKLSSIPEDRSGELADLEVAAKEQKDELSKLEAEVAELEAKKQSIEKEFEDYKAKYVVR